MSVSLYNRKVRLSTKNFLTNGRQRDIIIAQINETQFGTGHMTPCCRSEIFSRAKMRKARCKSATTAITVNAAAAQVGMLIVLRRKTLPGNGERSGC